MARWGLSQEEWDDAKRRLFDVLADAAADRATITYGDAARVAFGGRFSARSGALMDLLGEVDEEEDRRRGIMIASLVVRKDTGMPGEGYFAFIARMGRPIDDREGVWRGEAERVWAAYAKEDA